MSFVFAPHCPTCRHRVLLGTRRIAHVAWDGDGNNVVLVRCYCGRLLDAIAPSPGRPVLDVVDEWQLGA